MTDKEVIKRLSKYEPLPNGIKRQIEVFLRREARSEKRAKEREAQHAENNP